MGIKKMSFKLINRGEIFVWKTISQLNLNLHTIQADNQIWWVFNLCDNKQSAAAAATSVAGESHTK